MMHAISFVIIVIATSMLFLVVLEKPMPAVSQSPMNTTVIPLNKTIKDIRDIVNSKNATGALSTLGSVITKLPPGLNETIVINMVCENCIKKKINP